jgi:hypothetical protein
MFRSGNGQSRTGTFHTRNMSVNCTVKPNKPISTFSMKPFQSPRRSEGHIRGLSSDLRRAWNGGKHNITIDDHHSNAIDRSSPVLYQKASHSMLTSNQQQMTHVTTQDLRTQERTEPTQEMTPQLTNREDRYGVHSLLDQHLINENSASKVQLSIEPSNDVHHHPVHRSPSPLQPLQAAANSSRELASVFGSNILSPKELR